MYFAPELTELSRKLHPLVSPTVAGDLPGEVSVLLVALVWEWGGWFGAVPTLRWLCGVRV